MKWLLKIIFALLSVTFLFYLALPTPEFPAKLPGSVRSWEPADSETEERRGYFTNLTREEVQDHYRLHYTLPYGLNFLTIKLTYPPEDAYPLIRDQTRSTHLIEYVHPLRGSLFINELVAKEPKDAISYKGIPYDQKTTVKIIENDLWVRLLVGVMLLGLLWLVVFEWIKFIPGFVRELPRLRYVFKD